MISRILAHAGETHSTETTATIHEMAWYHQLVLFILALLAVGGLIWFITKRLEVVILVCSFLMLITGFLVYQVAPIVSVVSITLGLFATLSVTLIGLRNDKPKS